MQKGKIQAGQEYLVKANPTSRYDYGPFRMRVLEVGVNASVRTGDMWSRRYEDKPIGVLAEIVEIPQQGGKPIYWMGSWGLDPGTGVVAGSGTGARGALGAGYGPGKRVIIATRQVVEPWTPELETRFLRERQAKEDAQAQRDREVQAREKLQLWLFRQGVTVSPYDPITLRVNVSDLGKLLEPLGFKP